MFRMKSFTTEDLIHPFEMQWRKKRYMELTKNGDCYYFYRFKYLSDMCYSKKIKYFLNISECPICLEKIFNMKSCWITVCGHLFHKQCLREWEYQTRSNGNCPMCRKWMGLMEFFDGINYSVYPFIHNYLDLLDEYDNFVHRFCEKCDSISGFGACDSC